jgi:hypothetical protein
MPKYCTRNETEKCVMARIRRQKKLYQENFTLAQLGTWEKAEAEAVKWVKKTLRIVPDPIPIKDRMSKRNTSGVVGVRLANATRTKKGYVYPDWRWVAFWTGCLQSSGIGWSVNKYGDERAFVSAYLARKAETLDRDKIDSDYSRLKGTKEFKEILKLKQLSPP